MLPFADGALDIAYSNSVIEHVRLSDPYPHHASNVRARFAFAREIARVGKRSSLDHFW